MSIELTIAIAGIIGLIVGLAIGWDARKERDQRIRELENELSARMGKPVRVWAVSAEKGDGTTIEECITGQLSIEDVKARFGLSGPDVLWYNIDEVK